MKVLFLGTCACDYSEKLKTEYKNSFDYDARRSSCALINGKYLIDCGEHAIQSLNIANVNFEDISDIFITHLHSDHYKLENIKAIASSKKQKLKLWVREDAFIPEIENVEIFHIKSTKTYDVDGDLKVMGLKANHDENVYPQHFLFEIEGKKFLYACDGAWFLNETYYKLQNTNLSLLVLDATCGDYVGDYRMGEHNSIPMIRLMLPSLKVWGTVTENTKIYLSHIAPSLHKPHNEIVMSVQKDGLNVAYDGLEIEV